MKLSIITATYNSEKYLIETLDSVLIQNYRPLEYIVVDGASTDQTPNILKNYEAKFIEAQIAFKYISEKDKGIYDAWNKGVNIATGDWISFLGSDDLYVENALETYVNGIKLKPCNYISSLIELIDEDGNKIQEYGRKFHPKMLKIEMQQAHVGSFTKAELLKVSPFSIKYKIVGDYAFFLQNRNNINAAFIPKVTAKMRVGGVSSNDIDKVFKENLLLKNDLKILHPFINKAVFYYQKVKHNMLKHIRS